MKKLVFFFTGLIIFLPARAMVHNDFYKWEDIKVAEFLKLNHHDYERLVGHKLLLKHKLGFHLLKLSMKKAVKKKKDITMKEYMMVKKDPGILGGVMLGVLGLILFVFFLFLIFYKD
jgi:hypothetical protein